MRVINLMVNELGLIQMNGPLWLAPFSIRQKKIDNANESRFIKERILCRVYHLGDAPEVNAEMLRTTQCTLGCDNLADLKACNDVKLLPMYVTLTAYISMDGSATLTGLKYWFCDPEYVYGFGIGGKGDLKARMPVGSLSQMIASHPKALWEDYEPKPYTGSFYLNYLTLSAAFGSTASDIACNDIRQIQSVCWRPCDVEDATIMTTTLLNDHRRQSLLAIDMPNAERGADGHFVYRHSDLAWAREYRMRSVQPVNIPAAIAAFPTSLKMGITLGRNGRISDVVARITSEEGLTWSTSKISDVVEGKVSAIDPAARETLHYLLSGGPYKTFDLWESSAAAAEMSWFFYPPSIRGCRDFGVADSPWFENGVRESDLKALLG